VLSSGSSVTTLTVLDLGTGRVRGHPVALAGDADSVAWSPDGHWLFAATHDGRVRVLDARTGAARDLGVGLPPLTQLVLRATVSG
jgi:WD40 repeat protein